MIEIILVTIGTLVVISELAIFIVYGWFISKEMAKTFMDLNTSLMSINPYNPSILSLGLNHSIYVTKLPVPIMCKYHIAGVGIVPRFSKLHYVIEKYYVDVIKKSINEK